MKPTPVRRNEPAAASWVTTASATISSRVPGSSNRKATSVAGDCDRSRSLRMAMPPGLMSSAWHSSTLPSVDCFTAKVAAIRWPRRRSRGVFRRSMLMPDGTAPSGGTQKNS